MDAPAAVTMLLGFTLGLKHAADADHVVAVSTLLSEAGGVRRGALVGAWWGLGHLLTIFLAGSVIVVLRARASPLVEWALELAVALLLVWLGVRTIHRCFAGRYHFHLHHHGAHAHAHLHYHAHSAPVHEHETHAGRLAREVAGRGLKPMLVGMAHGLAGTAGVALVVLTSITSRAVGLLYLLVFGLGALTGMAAFSALLGLPFGHAETRLSWLRALRMAAGAASGILGVALTYRAFLPQAFPF